MLWLPTATRLRQFSCAKPTVLTNEMSYHAMRMRWCQAALLAFLRRWGVYIAAVLLLLTAGSEGALTSMAALCSWVVLPLFRAVTLSWDMALWATLAQSLVGAALAWALRDWLWRASWREAEAALPLPARVQRQSDALAALWAMAPWCSLQAVGAAFLLWANAPWLAGFRVAATVALLASMAVSWVGVVAALAWRRRISFAGPPMSLIPPTLRLRQAHARAKPNSDFVAAKVLPWPYVLLWHPLWRGPAQRLGRWLAVGSVTLIATGIALLWLAPWAPWCLAFQAALSIALLPRLSTLAQEELAPWQESTTQLPLRQSHLRWATRVIPLLPLVLALVATTLVLPPNAHRGVYAAYAVTLFGASALMCCVPTRTSDSRAARWLFCLCCALALASEVVR